MPFLSFSSGRGGEAWASDSRLLFGKCRYLSEGRGMIAYLVREVSGLSLTDLGRRMKRDVSSLSLAADKIMRCSKDDGEIRKRKQILEKKLS